jgi:hypothetical protein
MTEADRDLRNRTYALFVELGRAPAASELGDESAVKAGWRRLHEEHALVLDGADELRMCNPFSAVPTAYRVHAVGRSWYANCAWDAFGIPAALDADGRIESSCPDCGEPYALEVAGGRSDRQDLVFHCLVPAERWWADIVFT